MTKPPRLSDTPPGTEDIEAIAAAALETLPDILKRHVRDVVVRIEDFPDRETCAEMGLESPFDLLGLYRGVSIDRRSVADVADDIDMIFLYRRPLLDYWCEVDGSLEQVVRHVLIHEFGHHFGLSDADMAAIETEVSG